MITEINLANYYLSLEEIKAHFSDGTAKAIRDAIDEKVDKDGGKVLSTYDFEQKYKNALDNLGQTIANAVGNLDMIEVVGNNLPTSNIKTNKLYLKNNGSSSSENKYDIYIRVNNEWEKIDSLGFDISQYLTKSEAQNTYQPQGNYLTSVANGNITNGAVTLAKLNSDVYDATNGGTSDSSKLITSGAVFNGLSGKANSTHNQASSTITDSTSYSNIGNSAQNQGSINSAINTKLGNVVYKSSTSGLLKNNGDVVGINSTITSDSSNLVTNNAVKAYVDNIIGTIDNWLVQ